MSISTLETSSERKSEKQTTSTTPSISSTEEVQQKVSKKSKKVSRESSSSRSSDSSDNSSDYSSSESSYSSSGSYSSSDSSDYKKKKGKHQIEIEMSSEDEGIRHRKHKRTKRYYRSSSSEDVPYENEVVLEYEKPARTMSIRKFFHILFFRAAFNKFIPGHKGNIKLNQLDPIPRNFHVESYHKRITEKWENQRKKGKSSIFKLFLQMEWKLLIPTFLLSMIYEIFSLAYPLMAAEIIKWLQKPDAKIETGILFIFLALIFQLTVCFSQEFSRKWIFISSFRFRNGLLSLIYDKALKLNSSGIEEPGKLVNLMSNDAAVLLFHLEYSMYGLASPPMFIILFSLIFKNMGKSTWVPLVTLIGFILFNLLDFWSIN